MLAGIIAGKVGTRFGVPALLLFLITGMLFGSAGLGIQYNDTNKTQFVGMIALTVILFFGGFETKLKEMRTVLGPGIMLSTVGVILTTLCLGGLLLRHGPLGLGARTLHLPHRPSAGSDDVKYRLRLGLRPPALEEYAPQGRPAPHPRAREW